MYAFPVDREIIGWPSSVSEQLSIVTVEPIKNIQALNCIYNQEHTCSVLLFQKCTIFCGVMLYNLADQQCFWGSSVNTYQNEMCHIPDDSMLHTNCFDNLKYNCSVSALKLNVIMVRKMIIWAYNQQFQIITHGNSQQSQIFVHTLCITLYNSTTPRYAKW